MTADRDGETARCLLAWFFYVTRGSSFQVLCNLAGLACAQPAGGIQSERLRVVNYLQHGAPITITWPRYRARSARSRRRVAIVPQKYLRN